MQTETPISSHATSGVAHSHLIARDTRDPLSRVTGVYIMDYLPVARSSDEEVEIEEKGQKAVLPSLGRPWSLPIILLVVIQAILNVSLIIYTLTRSTGVPQILYCTPS